MSQNSSQLPAPLALPNSGHWLGNDGNWSTFAIQIGTPSQYFSVLPNPAISAIFVPDVAGCSSLNVTGCGFQRGVEGLRGQQGISFLNNGSTTWKELGFYRMDIDSTFAYNRNSIFDGNLSYGTDRLSSGSNTSRTQIEVKDQLVASYAFTDPFWVGQLGLGQRSVELSGKVYPSLLSRLKEDGKIPSLSFGYQAGAAYRFERVPENRIPASLVLGGYDSSRVGDSVLKSNNTNLAVGLRGIDLRFLGETTTLLQTDIMAFIDTSFPDIWLPPTVCDKFAKTLNLTYNATANRYAIPDEARSNLYAKSATFSFYLGTTVTRGTSNSTYLDPDTTSISLPYAAFDLKMKDPGSSSEMNYFPLRQAANESMYALGRAFLQEIYLSADLERGTFNLSNAVFTNLDLRPNIVPIEPLDRLLLPSSGSNRGSTSRPTKLEPGAIAGIVVSIVVAICCLATCVWWFCMRKQHVPDSKSVNDPPIYGKSELDTHTVEELPYDTRKTDLELDGTPVGEMYSPPRKAEMDALRGVEMDAPHGKSEVDSPHGRSEM